MNVGTMLANSWEYIIGFLAIGLIAYWAFDERNQTETLAETIEAVGERARTTTGGLAGGFGSLVVVLVSIFVTVGDELVDAFGALAPLVGEFPVLVGNVLIGILAYAGMSDLVSIEAWQFGVIAIAVMLVALTLRFGRSSSA